MGNLTSLLKTSRVLESLLMVSFFMVGLITIPINQILNDLPRVGLAFISSYTLVQSIYLMNSFLGYDSDLHNPRLDVDAESSTKKKFLLVSILLLLLALVLLNTETLLGVPFALVNYALWIFYGHRKTNLKGHWLGGTLVHLLSGVINFQFSLMFFDIVSVDSMLLAFYFALLFAAGHFHHMVIDVEADKQAGIQTFATRFGIPFTELMNAVFISLAGLYALILIGLKIISLTEAIPIFTGALLHLVLFFFFKKSMASPQSRLKFRTAYRIVHGIATAAFALMVWTHA